MTTLVYFTYIILYRLEFGECKFLAICITKAGQINIFPLLLCIWLGMAPVCSLFFWEPSLNPFDDEGELIWVKLAKMSLGAGLYLHQ